MKGGIQYIRKFNARKQYFFKKCFPQLFKQKQFNSDTNKGQPLPIILKFKSVPKEEINE